MKLNMAKHWEKELEIFHYDMTFFLINSFIYPGGDVGALKVAGLGRPNGQLHDKGREIQYRRDDGVTIFLFLGRGFKKKNEIC